MLNDVWIVVCFSGETVIRSDEFDNAFVFSSRDKAEAFMEKHEMDYAYFELIRRKVDEEVSVPSMKD